jgi:hypothetical protein
MLSKPFDFITSLSAEECEQKLSRLNTSIDTNRPIEAFEVTIYPREANSYNFYINYRRRGRRKYVLLGQTQGSIVPNNDLQTRVSGRTELDNTVLVQLAGMAFIFLLATFITRTPALAIVGFVLVAMNGVHLYRNFAHTNDVISTALLRS